MSRTAPHSAAREPTCEQTSGPTVGLPLEGVDLLLPAELLQSGEVVLLLLKPSPWFVLLRSLGTLAALAVAGMGLVLLLDVRPIPPLGTRDVVVLCVTLGGARLLWQVLEWVGRIYLITDRRVLCIGGALRMEIIQLPLRDIRETRLYATLRERCFRLGTLEFLPSRDGDACAAWTMIRHPLEVQRRVLQILRRYR